MGGYGSGRRADKGLAESCYFLDINYLNRNGYLRLNRAYTIGWNSGNSDNRNFISINNYKDSLILSYTLSSVFSEPEQYRYPVYIEWTSCNYGGKRPWLICPGRGCGRRAVKLYLNEKYFLCRHCNNLAYHSQRESGSLRLQSKVNKIKKKLGGNPGIFEPIPSKPKYMHWKTYYTLCAKANQANYLSAMELKKEFERTFGRTIGGG